MRYTLHRVEPDGTSLGFGSGAHGCGVVEAPSFPISHIGQVLRHMRVAAKLSHSQAADLLGISPVQLSSLERGSQALSAREWGLVLEEVYDELKGLLEAAAAKGEEPITGFEKTQRPQHDSNVRPTD